MISCYIFDIDGTVADLTHRRHHIATKPKNWPAFRAGCVDDVPIEHIRQLLHSLYATHNTVVFVSGRNESQRKDTINWMVRHNIHHRGMYTPGVDTGVTLYMRADGDYRDDSIVKLELLQKLRADGFEPIMAFDDRDRVVKMWRDNGVPCAQVAPGDF